MTGALDRQDDLVARQSSREQLMAKEDLQRLHEILRAAVVEVEIAIDTATYPDWSDTKENLLRAIDITRKLERDQVWSKLSKK